MRIGIDGSCLSNRRGFGRFARRLVEALSLQGTSHQFVVFVDEPSAGVVEIPAAMERVVVPVAEAPSRAASAKGRRRLRDMLSMGRGVARSNIDVMYFPATYSFFPVWNVGKLVVTMHDTLPLSHPELVFPSLAGRLSWRVKEMAAARWADRIVTVSEASKRDLSQWLSDGAERVRVITEGPDPIFRPSGQDDAADAALERYGLPLNGRYLIYVGGLSPHKNLVRLVDALAMVPDQSVRLVLVGDLGDVFHTHVPEIRQAIERNRLEDRVHLTGFVPDEELVYLYSRASALVQPSLLEGFGLPAVEAMSCGTPVIASRAGSLPEVVGDAGVYFDPRDTESIAHAIAGFLSNPTEGAPLGRRALERAATFTWDASAKALIECFNELECEDRAKRPFARGA